MLEYLAYRKFKKNKDQKKAEREKLQDAKDEAAKARPRSSAASSTASGPGPVLTDDDELFFERLTSETGFSDEDGKRPPLPPRGHTPRISWESDTDEARKNEATAVVDGKGKGKGKDEEEQKKQGSRFSFFVRKSGKKDSLQPTNLAVPVAEEEREKDDISRVLDDLNLSARNNKTFTLSKESAELVGSFTVVLKDLVNGVPTAAGDLKKLIEDHDGTLAKNYEKLPKSMQKIVTTLPTKVTGSLAPELLAVAAESQGLKSAPQGGIKAQAKSLLFPKSLSDLVTKPGAIVGMLKAIMNALKTRWPAFIGTNVIWSIALFLLLFVLWYCHKRGREVRLEREKSGSAVEAGSRIEELSDSDSVVGGAATPRAIEARSGTASPKRLGPPAGSSNAQ